MLDSFPKPTIFAHRGASNSAPENTISAFELAIQQGANAIELDVQLSYDKHIIVIHDHTVDRTTDGEGEISYLTLDTIKKLDAGSFFDSSFQGEPIPTLDDVFDTLGNKILINIELKNDNSIFDDLPERVADTVRNHKLVPQHILFSSFNPIALLKIKRLLPESPCGLLALSGNRGLIMRACLIRLPTFTALHPSGIDVTSQLVRKIHQMGKRLYPYTINDQSEMEHLLSIGVDGFFTDKPQLAVKITQSTNTQSENP